MMVTSAQSNVRVNIFSETHTSTADEPSDNSLSHVQHTMLSSVPIGAAAHPNKCAKKISEEINKKSAKKGPNIKLPMMVSNDMGNPHAHKKGRETRDSIKFT